MKVALLAPGDPRWPAQLARAPHDFHHLPGFVALSARTTEPGTPLAVLAEDSDGAMLLPFVRRELEGGFDAVSPYGYPCPVFTRSNPAFVSSALAAALEMLRAERFVSLFVRMHPLLDPDPAGFTAGTLLTHGETVVVDLSQPEEEQWRQHQSGHRSEINKAVRTGHEVLFDAAWGCFDDFVRLYTETMKRLEASRYYLFDRAYFEGMREALGPSGLHLGIVRIGGQVAAAALFTTVAGVVQYHLSGTDEAFAKERPTKLLLHHARQWATREGHRWFHLGGGLGAAQDSLFRFKAGFSKLRRTFRTWRVLIDRDRYAALTRAKHPSVDPYDVSGYFPSYRRP